MGIPKDPEKAALQRQRQSEAAKRRSASPEARQKMSERSKEALNRPGMHEKLSEVRKRHYQQPGAREKVSQRTKEAMAGPEVREKIREGIQAFKRDHPEQWAQGRARTREVLDTPEVRAKISQSQKARYANLDPEVHQVQTEARIAAMQQPEVLAKMSEITKQRLADPVERQKMRERTKEQMERPGMRGKLSEAQKKSYQAHPERAARQSETRKRQLEETDLRERIRAATKEAMQREDVRQRYLEGMEREGVMAHLHSPEVQEKRIQGIAKHFASKPKTSIEIIVEAVLQVLGVPYESQKHIGIYIADFYIPDRALVIECDGTYWHLHKPGAKEKDARKDAFLASKGYTILRLPEEKILRNELEALYEAIA